MLLKVPLRQALESCLGEMFVEHIRSGDETYALIAEVIPECDRRRVVLIVSRFERDQKPGIEKVRCHVPPYRWAS